MEHDSTLPESGLPNSYGSPVTTLPNGTADSMGNWPSLWSTIVVAFRALLRNLVSACSGCFAVRALTEPVPATPTLLLKRGVCKRPHVAFLLFIEIAHLQFHTITALRADVTRSRPVKTLARYPVLSWIKKHPNVRTVRPTYDDPFFISVPFIDNEAVACSIPVSLAPTAL